MPAWPQPEEAVSEFGHAVGWCRRTGQRQAAEGGGQSSGFVLKLKDVTQQPATRPAPPPLRAGCIDASGRIRPVALQRYPAVEIIAQVTQQARRPQRGVFRVVKGPPWVRERASKRSMPRNRLFPAVGQPTAL